MAVFTRFEDIKVWQEGRELVKAVYALTRREAFAKDWGLKDQIQRAAVCVPSNVAEGYERSGNKEFAKFLWIAKGSAGEVVSQLYHAKDLGYITDADFKNVYEMANTLCAKIYRLISTLQPKTAYKKL